MENLEVISSYTSRQAVEDGILFDITTVNPAWKKGLFNLVTVNLMNQGYFEADGRVRTVNLVDLLNQANQIVKKASKNFTQFDSFFSGKIELPSGKQQEIFIEQNEENKFTLLLPEDH